MPERKAKSLQLNKSNSNITKQKRGTGERHFVKKLSLSVFIPTKQMTLYTRIVKVS